MEKISTIMQIIFWAIVAVGMWVAVLYLAFQHSALPLYEAILHWLEFGYWEIDTFATRYGVVANSSWVGWNKIVMFFGNIPTWWPSLILIGYLALWAFGPIGHVKILLESLREKI